MCRMQSAEKSLGQIDDSITLAHIQHPHGYLIMCFLRVSSAILSVKHPLSNIKRTFKKRLCCKECIRIF